MTELTKLSITEIFEILPEVQLSQLPELITEIVEHIDDFDYDYLGEQYSLVCRLLYGTHINLSHLSEETLEKIYLIIKAFLACYLLDFNDLPK